LDCSLLLGSLHGGSNEIYPPWSDEILISMHKLLMDMRHRHAINKESFGDEGFPGWGIGRYPEDVYDGDGTSGGNPWFLCTASVSEVIFRSITHFVSQRHLEITDVNLPFFQNVLRDPKVGRVGDEDEAFNSTLILLSSWADGFLEVVRKHAANRFHLSEQFDRNQPGFQKGAKDLTWSYGSVIEALEWRKRARQMLGWQH